MSQFILDGTTPFDNLQDGDCAHFSASQESVRYSQNFLDQCNENHCVPKKIARKIQICSDEIMSNIIKYSHAKTIYVNYKFNNNAVTLAYEDDGILFNPLKAQKPDVTLSAEKRPIGGLGLFMVKKLTSSVVYSENDGRNHLKLVFEFNPDDLSES